MSIEVRNIAKKFGSYTAVNNVSLKVRSGELVSLLGPSGSGKTTLLRIIAGLEVPDSGSIIFNGEDTTNVSVRDRKVGFVFQHYALFRHMTVFANVAFGLSVLPSALAEWRTHVDDRGACFLAPRHPRVHSRFLLLGRRLHHLFETGCLRFVENEELFHAPGIARLALRVTAAPCRDTRRRLGNG